MPKSKSITIIAAVIMACLLITTMLIVPTASISYNPNAETSFHTIIVDVTDGRATINIVPLALRSPCEGDSGCEVDDGCPIENTTCCSGEAFSFESVVLEHGENYAVTLFSVENGEDRFEATITRTRLWKHAEARGKLNVTFSLTETAMVSEGFTVGSRELAYIIEYAEYSVCGVSIMSLSQSSAAYETCFSMMNYIPADKTEILSLEIVHFNGRVTLSQHYAILGEAAKEMRKLYQHSLNPTFNELVDAYHVMEKEAKGISKLITSQLSIYDHEILRSTAMLRDDLACTQPIECYMPNGGGGGGGGTSAPSGCNWACVISCVLQSPDTLATCMYVLYACAALPGPENPACWILIACVLVYGIGCALACCWW